MLFIWVNYIHPAATPKSKLMKIRYVKGTYYLENPMDTAADNEAPFFRKILQLFQLF